MTEAELVSAARAQGWLEESSAGLHGDWNESGDHVVLIDNDAGARIASVGYAPDRAPIAAVPDLLRTVIALHAQLAAQAEALAWYGDIDNHDGEVDYWNGTSTPSAVHQDEGERARKALAGADK